MSGATCVTCLHSLFFIKKKLPKNLQKSQIMLYLCDIKMILLFMKSSNLLPLTKYFVNEQYALVQPTDENFAERCILLLLIKRCVK